MPNGTPAELPSVHLDEELRCKLFGESHRQAFCGGPQPYAETFCASREETMTWLVQLEHAMKPV